MPDIHIRRDHTLGLARARELSAQWVAELEAKFDMACNVVEGEQGDTVEFKRSGASGSMQVAPDHFDLSVKLGFLLGAFRQRIEAEIEQNLDTLLAAPAKT